MVSFNKLVFVGVGSKKSPSLFRLPVQFTIKLSTFLIFAVCGPASSNILPKSPKGRRGSEAQMPSEKRNHKNNSTNLCMKRRFPCVHSVKFLMVRKKIKNLKKRCHFFTPNFSTSSNWKLLLTSSVPPALIQTFAQGLSCIAFLLNMP